MGKTVAVVGASSDRRKFGNKALRAFKAAGCRVIPVNPNDREIEGMAAYASVLDVPERIDMAIKPEPREGLGIGFGKLAGLVRIRGTLAEPTVGIDELGIAKGALSTGAAFATGGLSLLAEGLVGRATADSTPCLTALGKAPTPKPATSTPAQQQPGPAGAKPEQRGVGGFLRGLGQSLEDAVGGKK